MKQITVICNLTKYFAVISKRISTESYHRTEFIGGVPLVTNSGILVLTGGQFYNKLLIDVGAKLC